RPVRPGCPHLVRRSGPPERPAPGPWVATSPRAAIPSRTDRSCTAAYEGNGGRDLAGARVRAAIARDAPVTPGSAPFPGCTRKRLWLPDVSRVPSRQTPGGETLLPPLRADR